MESTSKHKVIVCRELIERRVEVFLENETAGFVDDYQGIDNPTSCQHGSGVALSELT